MSEDLRGIIAGLMLFLGILGLLALYLVDSKRRYNEAVAEMNRRYKYEIEKMDREHDTRMAGMNAEFEAWREMREIMEEGRRIAEEVLKHG